jgi:hypothetical protein
VHIVTSSTCPSASISREGDDDRFRRGDELAATVDVLGVRARVRDGRAGILNCVSAIMLELLAVGRIVVVETRFCFLHAAWRSIAEAGRLKDSLMLGLGCCDMIVREGANGMDMISSCRVKMRWTDGIVGQDEDLGATS